MAPPALRTTTSPDPGSGSESGRSFEDIVELIDLAARRGLDPERRTAQTRRMVEAVERTRNRKLFLPLVRALKTGDPGARPALVRCIPLVNEPRAHPELCSLLDSKDVGLRAAAALALVSVGGPTVLRVLGERMSQPGFPGRAEAIDVLGTTAAHRALPAMLACLPVASAAERVRIARLIADREAMATDRVGALSVLKAMLGDPDDTVVATVVRAFGRIATEEEWFDHISPVLESPFQQVVLAAIHSLRRFASNRAITVLHGRLRAGPKASRMAVLDTLEAIGTDRVLPVLVVGLGHDDLAVRNRAGEVLASLGNSGRVDIARTVLWLLRSPDINVRRMAVGVARDVRDPNETLWPRLFELLRDEDWWVRERVADALIALAGVRMLGHLSHLLDDPQAPIRMFAVDVIGRLGEPKALGALVRRALDDTDWWVRERAMEAIAVLGDKRAAPYLVRILAREPSMRIAALHALSRLKDTSAATKVAALIRDREPDIRLAALRCLESLDAAAVEAELGPVLEDHHPEVRDLARQLQARWTARRLAASSSSIQVQGTALDNLLLALAEKGADDLVLAPGQPPLAKHMGRIEQLADEPLESETIAAMVLPLLSAQQVAELNERRDVDTSYEVPRSGLRVRANIFHQLHGTGVVFRVIRREIPSLDSLGLPAGVSRLMDFHDGLVLVGGATGSGKSTTIAALIAALNRRTPKHVITLEDPIEVVHPHSVGLINQRELGIHTGSYADAMRATLRQDPDVILVGELRDLETIRFAVTAAETGHLVLGTVHTVSADTTVDRLINSFPAGQQSQVRTMLAGSLRAVLCQTLMTRADGKGRVLASEVLFNTGPVSNLIRQGKSHQLLTTISTARASGMQSMDADLIRLLRAGLISVEDAYLKSRRKSDFETFLLGGELPPADEPEFD